MKPLPRFSCHTPLRLAPRLVFVFVSAWIANPSLAQSDLPSGATPSPQSVTKFSSSGSRFLVNEKPTFLLGMSYYGALGASRETIQADLDNLQRHGFNWIRLWANWGAFDRDVGAVDHLGQPRPAFLEHLAWLIAECDHRSIIVDVSLSRGNGVAGPLRLQSLESHQRAVRTLVNRLKPWANWYLDLSNERNVGDKRFTSFEDLQSLRQTVQELDSTRLVTASHAGDPTREDVKRYLEEVRLDFISPHRPRDAQSPSQTKATTQKLLAWMQAIHHLAPVHYQEPFRRGYSRWNPRAEDYITDLQGSQAGGAAGWCFHNGDQRTAKDGRPRRSFDLGEKRLFHQLDPDELKAVNLIQKLGRFEVKEP